MTIRKKLKRIVAAGLNYFGLRPGFVIIFTFAAFSLLSALLLNLGFCSATGESIGFTKSFFTAISAATTTGLTLVPTLESWSFFGKLIIMLTIQIGGLGIITIGSLLSLLFFRGLGMGMSFSNSQELGENNVGEIKNFVLTVVSTSFIFELITFLCLLPTTMQGNSEDNFHQFGEALFFAVSSFNNAGFDISGSNFLSYSENNFFLIVIFFSGFIGGLGYPVIFNVLHKISSRSRLVHLSLNTKLTFITSVLVTFIGSTLFIISEWNGKLGVNLGDLDDKIVKLFTYSSMARFDGFGFIDVNLLSPFAKLLTIINMFIGGSNGSTAGGVKVTTIAVLALATISVLFGKSKITIWHKTINDRFVKLSVTVFLTYIILIFLGFMLLSGILTREFDMTSFKLIFDIVSALSNCGLSSGAVGLMSGAE
ncbi:MAG: hypothetical protein LBN03_01940, partial [Bifidobacteriaceae bacterium]|nr:hypothetical protein [Bifidobacteriaceae bacterium]